METMLRAKSLRIGIVAGEISGDILGAGFIKEVKEHYPDTEFVGIGGSKMKEFGCEVLFNMEELSVMGIVEVLGRLPLLLRIKRKLVEYFVANPPDVFVGIDSPDFNLRLEKSLKDKGIKTVHYVSPSVWAWRQERIFSIAKATDLVLALLPFEKEFYDKFNVSCDFVGHPMADNIPLYSDKTAARNLLGLDQTKSYLAVLPGSRYGEMKLLAPIFIETCRRLKIRYPDLCFIVALVNEKLGDQFKQVCQVIAPELEFVLVEDTARSVITASDCTLLASGTVALECMLVKRPMVVGYKMNTITAWLARRMVKINFVSLPNILAGRELVPERIQESCTPDILANDVTHFLSSDNSELMSKFTQLHEIIRCDSDKLSARAVLNLIGR
ncbi:Lipid-A-disaccharide synthase [Candidatus Enterovibrio escicola]|uniref:Lipid-A-disaccharide synthase n=2 Tax=Candidatus Enterovibrio escicola TaxID=1927127 RepID=A0A2A5SZJ5_9GAMM|nr:lipid-A-disaccharide synthase [Candidatus Enterovibrio escacola]PCS21321.1 Lipid-A-disaccharide synthase [Candidatus Enterovibrio escacola]